MNESGAKVLQMSTIYYHHPDDKQFSLDYSDHDSRELVKRIAGYDGDVAVKLLEYDVDERFYAVYTSRVGGGAVSDMEFDVSDRIAAMGEVDGKIVARLLEIYQSLVSRNEEEENDPVEAYKNINIQKLPDALEEVQWVGTATEIAGRLASNVVLEHALPNANHRTAVALIQLYLRRIAPDFSMPETKKEVTSETYDWREWVNEYIEESKRILTVRRNHLRFQHVQKYGVTAVERKHGVQIELSNYDLDLYPWEAKEKYAEEHELLWIELVEEAVERAGKAELKEQDGLNKREFANAISALD
jgi:prophage maintenance system killer protein